MRLAILTTDAPNQAALCRMVQPTCELVGIVLSRNIPTRPRARRLRRFLNRIEGRWAGRPFVRSWHAMQRRFHELAPQFPEVPTLRVPNINDAQTVATLEHWNPDLVLVSGTNLVGPAIREWAVSHRRGLINLHTGLSPYVKGGPDCTNWCLAEGTVHLIGNTVLWLDAGVDSGPILATELTPLTGHETLEQLHWNVMTHAHDLCRRAMQALTAKQVVPRIPQEQIADGRTFSSLEWNARAMRRAWTNFHRDITAERIQSRAFQERCASVKTFPLNLSAAGGSASGGQPATRNPQPET